MTTYLHISIDLEADGPIPGTTDYSMSSLGACLVEHPQERFYVELRPISKKFNPEALAVSGLDRERLILEGTKPKKAMRQFENWVKLMLAKYNAERALAVTLSEWDQMFVDWYSVHFLGHRVVKFTGIEMKSYFMGKHDIKDFGQTGRDEMLQHYPTKHAHTHRADDDAIEQADIFRRMLADEAKLHSLRRLAALPGLRDWNEPIDKIIAEHGINPAYLTDWECCLATYKLCEQLDPKTADEIAPMCFNMVRESLQGLLPKAHPSVVFMRGQDGSYGVWETLYNRHNKLTLEQIKQLLKMQ